MYLNTTCGFPLESRVMSCPVMAKLALDTMFSGAPWVPTQRSVAREMCKMAGLKSGSHVLDLGCGDGAILLVAAKEFGATGVGIELNPLLVAWARLRARMQGVSDRVQIIRGNMFTTALPDVDTVMLYLLPRAMRRIERRLKERYPSLCVVSNGFVFDTLQPAATLDIGEANLRLYRW